jgi:uncharacterized membrane protein YtjA (UPF0391 family)
VFTRKACRAGAGFLNPQNTNQHICATRVIAQDLFRADKATLVASASSQLTFYERRIAMLGWALTFLVIALIAAALGFGGIAGAAAGLAKIIFFIFLVLLLISLVMHVSRGSVP